MPELTLEQGSTNGIERSSVDERVMLEAYRTELDDYYVTLESFATSDPADVMAHIASIHARLVGMRSQLVRSNSQRANSLRTREVDSLMDALEFQFKVASRVIALAEHEWHVAGGAN